MLYSMKDVCEQTGMTYEALKFYCNQGLVPHVKRDAGNRRVFDERDLAWIQGLGCLKRCGLSIREMRHYVQLCLAGAASIPERKDAHALPDLQIIIGLFMSVHTHTVLYDREPPCF